MFQRFHWIKQLSSMQCGAACLAMICRYYGAPYRLAYIDSVCDTHSQGVSLHALKTVASELGFSAMAVKIPLEKLIPAPSPFIVHWEQRHFIVVYKISKDFNTFYIADPAKGKLRLNRKDFMKGWSDDTSDSSLSQGIALLLEPDNNFEKIFSDYRKDSEKHCASNQHPILENIKIFRKELFQVASGMLFGLIIQLLFPYLTQSIVDKGILKGNLNIIYLILIGECIIVIASAITDFIRRWLLLHISMRLNISLLSDFIDKLFRLPMKFFDTQHLGDVIQRMEDNKRIQSFLTSEFLTFSFTAASIFVFSIVLACYDLVIFSIYVFFSLLDASWVCVFLQKRKILDYDIFAAEAANQNCTYQLINSMQETKLQGCESKRRWEWDDAQADLFELKIKNLKLQQFQESGAICINELKNILITVFAATSVIHGSLSLGQMMAIQFIIGQLNSPIRQLISFIQSLQNVKISIDRVKDVKELKDEYKPGQSFISFGNICFNNVSFSYDRFSPVSVLKNISLEIPKGKVTAIVGSSGSGKSTLIKLLLGYYHAYQGNISIGNFNINQVSLRDWRKKCGVVMQDGHIYYDSISANIALEDTVDSNKLEYVLKVAELYDYVQSLPLKSDTKIGKNGKGLSLGQKQRILIARALYKDPELFVFDEATNSLDSVTERKIVENLEAIYKEKTAIIIAHRLSTVKRADMLIVMNNGEIVEKGTFEELIQRKGPFYELVKNQIN